MKKYLKEKTDLFDWELKLVDGILMEIGFNNINFSQYLIERCHYDKD